MQSFLKANDAQLKSSYTPTLDDITPKLQGNDSVDLLGLHVSGHGASADGRHPAAA